MPTRKSAARFGRSTRLTIIFFIVGAVAAYWFGSEKHDVGHEGLLPTEHETSDSNRMRNFSVAQGILVIPLVRGRQF